MDKEYTLKSVQVLLSTYNGESYLREQLDSLLRQEGVDVDIMVRDDGSLDETLNILKEYQEKYSCITYYAGENIGAWQSFFDLMKHADTKAQYVALCDQDDFWLPEKLSKGVNQLENMCKDKPLLYCSDTIPVDENLQRIKVTIYNRNFRPAFGNAVIQNIFTGCTGIMNQKLLKMACREVPRFTVMHDWWIYLIASCYGEVYFDENAYIYYRQHGKNEIGARITRAEQMKYRFRTYRKRRGRIYRQLEEFDRIFHVKGENKQLLDLVMATRGSMKKRINMVMNRKIYRQRISDDLIYKGIVLIGDA